MSKSKILVFLCLAFIGGVFLNSIVNFPRSLWPGFLFISSFLIAFGGVNKKSALIGFTVLALALGVFRVGVFEMKNQAEDLIKYHEKDVTLKGIVIDEVQKKRDQQKLVFKAETLNSQKVEGRALISAELYPEYNYGDKLKLKGELREPAVFDDFNYKEYLAEKQIYSVAYYPEIEILKRNQGNIFFGFIYNLKNKARDIIEMSLLPPQSSVLKAVTLGDRFGLSDELKTKLNHSGTRHIVAISGLHIILFMELLFYLFLALGLWRGQAYYLVFLFLFLFVLFVGAPASAIRASLMGTLVLTSQKLGRLREADKALLLVASIMLLFDPSLLLSSVGFQLSFTATLGIVYLKPILDRKTENLSNSFGLKDVLTMTLSAQAGVLGLLVFHFGRFSLISPLANIFIVPMLPVVMISGLSILAVGGIWTGLAKILAIIPHLFLSYITILVDLFSSFDFSSIEFGNFIWPVFIFYYLVLSVLIVYITKSSSRL